MTDNIEELLTREEQLESLSEDQRNLANAYHSARVEYAKAYNFAKVSLAKRINKLFEKKKNIGIEMAELMLMASDLNTEEQYFIKACKARDLARAEYKGIAECIDAIKSQKMSILGIMKNSTDGEKYSKQEQSK